MKQNYSLSDREWEVVQLLLEGKSNKMIALSLGISERTVEFHLKNIYEKCQVGSRVELILKLGTSTVDGLGEKAENRDTLDPRMEWAPSFRETVSIIGQELQMKSIFDTRHVLVGVVTALLTGFLCIAPLLHWMSLAKLAAWIAPLAIILALIGLTVGVTAKRNGNTLGKTFLSTLVGTSVGPLAMIPLTVAIILPIGKLTEAVGLVNRAAMPSDVTMTLVITGMLAIWLIVGIAIGITLLFVAAKKRAKEDVTQPAANNL